MKNRIVSLLHNFRHMIRHKTDKTSSITDANADPVPKETVSEREDLHIESYDLFLSIGSACRPAHHLALNNLRLFSAPLDWQMSYSLDTVIQLFKTSFSSFFCNISEDIEKTEAENNRWVIDKTNNIISKHHFDKNIPLEDSQKDFIAKMQRRYTKLHNKLQTSKTVMLVCNRVNDIKEFEKFLIDFSALYPHLYITLMNMRNDSSMDNTEIYTKKINLSDKLTIIEHTFNDSIDLATGEKYRWTGNNALWSNVLSGYCLESNKAVCERLKGKNITVYGTDFTCPALIKELSKYGIKAAGVVVTGGKESSLEEENSPKSTTRTISSDDVVFIALKDPGISSQLKDSLLSKGYNKVVELGTVYRTLPNIEDIRKM